MRSVGRLHVLTDADQADPEAHLLLARQALEGGAEVIQLRQKGVSTRVRIATARALVELCRRAEARLIVNDRVDVALAADADGVHLGPDDFPLSLARELLGPDRILGASAGTPEEAEAAMQAGADYLGVGSVYATASKPDAGSPIGAAGLARVQAVAEVPVIAIGGIDASHVAEVVAAGVHGIAVIAAVARAEDPLAATRALKAALAGGES